MGDILITWHLEDVVARARKNPDQFFVPSEDERSACAQGDLVRLHFVLRNPSPEEPRAERMWVEVNERVLEGVSLSYKGVLTNPPRYIKGLAIGDLIAFLPTHIAQTILPKSHPDWLEIGQKYALVSARVLEKGRQARFAYRETPDYAEDSGWRLFRGDEAQEYVDEATNIRRSNVGWLVDRDPTLRQIVRADVDSAFERGHESDDWVRVKEWKAPDD
jgi:hypothetical protein